MVNGGHLDFSRWLKINSFRPSGGRTSYIKFEVDWGNDFKDIAFTKVVHTIHF